MKTLLIYPPFCTPASPPYSIANLHAFLGNNLPEGHSIDVLDLNIEFHKRRFPEEQRFYRGFAQAGSFDMQRYDSVTNAYKKVTEKVYSESNRAVIEGQHPEMFDEMLGLILTFWDDPPDIAAFSIVYSSQAFYALSLIRALKEKGIKTVIGGPAVNQKLRAAADATLSNELELLDFIKSRKTGKSEKSECSSHDSLNFRTVLDFSIFPLREYFTPEPCIPIRASNTCFYQKCAFCTHHRGGVYMEFPLENITGSIKQSRVRHVFIVDDLIHRKRLLKLAEALKPLSVSWMCQLKPTADIDDKTLQALRESGLKIIMWGVESANDRVLEKMDKGTNIDDITKVIRASHDAGIKNVVYMMFGFPTETREEAQETMKWLDDNKQHIDLVSTSIFGLQKNTPIYSNPEQFCITRITEHERTVLDESMEYEVSGGMTREEAKRFRSRNMRKLEAINRFPKSMNFFREHMLCLS